MPTTFDPVKLGPCLATFGPLTIDITKGGVTVAVAPILKEIKIDQYGDSAVDDRIVGWDIKAEVPMARTDYDSLRDAATFLEEQGGVLVDRKLGASMRNYAETLVLHPVQNTDLSEDILFHLAAPTTALELKYGYDDERIYKVDFRAYPKIGCDPADPGNFIVIGDPSDIASLYKVTFTCLETTTPVPGVKLSVVGRGSQLTNAAGEAIFHLPPGDYVYAADKSPYTLAYNGFTVVAADLPVAVAMSV